MAVQHRDKHSRFGDFCLTAALKTSTIYIHYALGFCLAVKQKSSETVELKESVN